MDTQIEYHGPTDTHGRCHFSLGGLTITFPATPRANTCAGSGASISTPTPVNTVI